MPYISSVERMAIKKGLQEGREKGREEGREKGREEGREKGREEGRKEGIREGLLAGIALGVELKFGEEGVQLLPEIQELEDIELLRAIHQRIKTANTAEELRQMYR